VDVTWFCFFFFDYARHDPFEKEREREREKGRNVAKNYEEVVERKYLLLRLKKMCAWMDVVLLQNSLSREELLLLSFILLLIH
jgi:hypothetical protein